MKKFTVVLLSALFVLVSPVVPDGCGVMPVLADGPSQIAQGVLKQNAAFWISDARGWRQGGTLSVGTQINIAFYDTNWVQDTRGCWICRWDVAIYGVDKAPETQYGSPLLGTAGQPIQIGEVVYAGPNCRKVYYPGLGQCGVIPSGTLLKVANKIQAIYDSCSYLYVWVNQQTNQPAWIKETDVERKVVVAASENVVFDWDNVVLVVAPLASHLAGNGRSINVTLQQAEEAFRAVLAGKGQIFSRASDDRIFFDIVLGPYRYVGFVSSQTGNLDNFFLPAERYQQAHHGWNIRQVILYIENLKAKGGYYPIRPDQVPDWIRQKWLGPSPLAMARAVIQTSEACMVFMIMPQYQLRRFSDPRVNVTN